MNAIEFLKNRFVNQSIEFIPSVVFFDKGERLCDYKIDGRQDYIHLYAKTDLFTDDFYIQYTDTGIIVRRSFKNTTKDILKIKELKVSLNGINFGGRRRDDYFYSIENPRVYEVYTFPIDYERTKEDAINSEFDLVANNRWADPGVVSERINNSPYQPFPAILISNYKSKYGFVHGTLSQKVFYHNYIIKHLDNGISLNIFSSFKAVDYLEVASGRVLVDEWYFGETDKADDYNKIFDNYTAVLRKKLPALYGASDINRHSLVWGSWNDGLFRDISHDLLLKEAKAVKKYFPNVEWFQLDDGYAVHTKKENEQIAHGLGAPYENDGIDYQKFPYGLKGFADEVRKIGLRPALWIGGACSVKSKIYREHPEWFSDYSLRMTRRHPLDTSISEVREYMMYALDKLILDYGFEAVKHDFWSYPYEESGRLYKNQEKSGYEYRRWWTRELRKRLPTDGYLQTGCDVVLANPFLGEDFTNYRYGIDIASGNWDYIKTTMLWGCACFATHTGDLFIPNSDAVGLLDGLNDDDFILWINFVMITHSMVELSGRYSKENVNQKRLKILQKATCNINNGQDVYYAGFDYRKKGQTIPEIMYTMTPIFSGEGDKDFMPLRTVALFNFSEEPRCLEINPMDLELSVGEYVYTNIWDFEQVENNILRLTLQPHTSKMFSVNKKKEYAIFDANCKISNASQSENEINFDIGAIETAEIWVTKKLSCVKVNDKEISFDYENGVVKFACKEGGKISFIFDANSIIT